MRDVYFKSFLFMAAVLWAGVLVFNLGSSPNSTDSVPSEKLGVSLSPSGVNILFTDTAFGENGETGFDLKRQTGTGGNFVTVATLPVNSAPSPSQVTTTDSVPSGNVYTYQVAACNLVGCSTYITSNVLTVPEGAPTILSASVDPTNPNTLNLQWTDNADNEYAYQIERSDDGGLTYSVITNALPVNSASYTDSNVPSGNYGYRVIALNNLVGNSAPSNVASATIISPPVPPTVPSTPTGLLATLT